MRRRKFIAVSSGLAVSASGCLGALGEPSEEENGENSNDGGETGTNGGSDEDARSSPFSFSVNVENPAYVVTTRSTFSHEMNRAESVEEFDEPTRGYVREAVEEGRADIDELDDALLEALESVRHVRDGDDVYALDHSLPEYVVTGEVADVTDDEVDEDRVVHVSDDIVRALGPDNRQIVMMRSSVVGGGRDGLETGEYRTTSLTDELAEFLDETDYLGVSTSENPTVTDEYVELELSQDYPDERYVEADLLSHEELFEVDEARYPDELPDDVEEVVRTAVDGEYRGDTLPEGFEEAVGDAYFLIDDEAHRPELLVPDYDDVPVDVRAEVVDAEIREADEAVDEETFEEYRDEFEDAHDADDEDALDDLVEEVWDDYRPDDGARFELTLENTSEESVSVFSGAPAPFGVLYAERTKTDADDDGGRRLVWSETYVEDGHVNVGPYGLMVNDIGLNTEFEPGETETESYEVGYAPGEYRVEETVSVSRGRRGVGDEESWTYPYTVVIGVEGEGDDGDDGDGGDEEA